MSDTDRDAAIDELGPIDYLVVEYPAGSEPDGSGLDILQDLVRRGTIRILDLAFVGRADDGTLVRLELSATGLEGDAEATLVAEVSSGLLDDDDLDEAMSVLEPGATAAVLVYENTWAAPFAVALRRNGARFVAGGRIPTQAILATLDALDAVEAAS